MYAKVGQCDPSCSRAAWPRTLHCKTHLLCTHEKTGRRRRPHMAQQSGCTAPSCVHVVRVWLSCVCGGEVFVVGISESISWQQTSEYRSAGTRSREKIPREDPGSQVTLPVLMTWRLSFTCGQAAAGVDKSNDSIVCQHHMVGNLRDGRVTI